MPRTEGYDAFLEPQVAGEHRCIGSMSQIAEDGKEGTGQSMRTLQLKSAGWQQQDCDVLPKVVWQEGVGGIRVSTRVRGGVSERHREQGDLLRGCLVWKYCIFTVEKIFKRKAGNKRHRKKSRKGTVRDVKRIKVQRPIIVHHVHHRFGEVKIFFFLKFRKTCR